MESIWKQTTETYAHRALSRGTSVDVAVIGGGLAGILTAYLLAENGADVIVLEKNTVGSGQTGNTTAKITAQHGLIYDRLTAAFGKKKAGHYAEANQAAVARYAEIIRRLGIDCDFTECPAYLYSTENAKPLRREANAAAALGLPVSFTRKTALPFEVAGAVRMEGQACFHPLKFLRALAGRMDVYEHTPVQWVRGNRIGADGHTVTAKHIMFACHFPFLNKPGYYFLRMHQERSYVLALKDAAQLDGTYVGMDAHGYSFRNYGDLLLLGGADHRTGDNKKGGKYAALERAAAAFYPGSTPVARWSAQDCITLDGIPYIGQFSRKTPDWYVATGFAKWGMSTSMVAAMLLSQSICGLQSPWADVFSPARCTPLQSLPAFLGNGARTAQSYAKRFFSIPRKRARDLSAGRGGIVKTAEGKAGVFLDRAGHTHTVAPTCPHLGCQLTWNPDEQSWDCPCHGSRFDCDGRLLDEPAEKDIGRDA